MKLSIKQIASMALLIILCLPTSAQTVEIEGVRSKEFRGVRSIEDFGYYTYYVNEKVGKGMVEFALEVYDLSLKQIKKSTVQVSKSSILQGAEFNGEHFLFVFVSYKKKTNTFIVMDKSGNIVKETTIPNKKIATAATIQVYPDMDGSGFFLTRSVKEKKWGFQVEKLDAELSQIWEKTYTVRKGYISVAAGAAANGRMVVISTESPSLMSRKYTGKVISMDSKTGEKQYEYNLYDGSITAIPNSFLIEEDGTVCTAGMYFNGEKWDSKNSDGIFFAKVSPDGTELAKTAIDWDKGIQEALKATSRKFSIGSKPKVLFHEIAKDANGNYQAIAETFRKTVKAGTALAFAAGSGGDAPMGFTVMDFIVFNFSEAGKPMDINKIAKPYKSIYVDGTIAKQGGLRLAQYLKTVKMFTYEFTTPHPETKSEVIVFTNFERPKLGAGDPYIGIATMDIGGESKTMKIPLNKRYSSYLSGSASNLRTGALENKDGKVALFIYDKKKKMIMMSLEDIANAN